MFFVLILSIFCVKGEKVLQKSSDPVSFVPYFSFPSMIHEVQENLYQVRHVQWKEEELQQEYQRLRTEVFVKQLHWAIPVTDGCERDRYDVPSQSVNVFCIYGRLRGDPVSNRLLGGCRIFSLQSWEESMVMNEFRDAGMIPDHVLAQLQERYPDTPFIEVTRLCVRRKQHMPIQERQAFSKFSLETARDLTYAAVYATADREHRRHVLGIATAPYLKVLDHTHFVYEVLHHHDLHTPSGYALIIIDLQATAHAMLAAGAYTSVARMLSGTRIETWVGKNIQIQLTALLEGTLHHEHIE